MLRSWWAGTPGAGENATRLGGAMRGRWQRSWHVRALGGVAVAFAATSGTVGGVAIDGFESSIANAPLLSSQRDTATELHVQGLASNGAPESPASGDEDASDGDENDDEDGQSTGDGDSAHQDILGDMPRTLSAGEVRTLARAAGWPESRLGEVVQVARCESTFNPAARNGSSIRGLMQLHTMWFSHAGISLSRWSDPLANLQVALSVFNYDIERGNPPWTQWECRPSGYVGSASAGEPNQAEDAPADTPRPAPDTPAPAPTSTSAPDPTATTAPKPTQTPVPDTPEPSPESGGEAAPDGAAEETAEPESTSESAED